MGGMRFKVDRDEMRTMGLSASDIANMQGPQVGAACVSGRCQCLDASESKARLQQAFMMVGPFDVSQTPQPFSDEGSCMRSCHNNGAWTGVCFDEFFGYGSSLEEAGSPQQASEAPASLEEEKVFSCDDVCFTCGDGTTVFVSRGQSFLQKISKIMYFDLVTAGIKIGYHVLREAWAWANGMNPFKLPNECPKVEITTQGVGLAPGQYLSTALGKDNEVGELALLKKSMKSLDRIKMTGLGINPLSLGSKIPKVIEYLAAKHQSLCGNHGGLTGAKFHGVTSIMFSSKTKRQKQCLR